jgi:hypothetical protein
VEKYRNAAEAASNHGPLSYQEFIHQDESALMITLRQRSGRCRKLALSHQQRLADSALFSLLLAYG